MPATGGESQFQDHIVNSIRQERPPKEMNLLQVRLAGEIANELNRVFGHKARRKIFRAGENLSPFGVKGDGEAWLK
ncbi:MAG TPA: hypothetical protein VG326_17635 [Tepidisphaeraceae bacterium]|jgi:hypothetical protein|nr:hypothetical protein [Tepidisphaeraceae bacterium]